MYIHDVFLNLKQASAGAFARPVRLFSFVVAAVVAPFVLLTIGGSEPNKLPWSFWVTILLLLMVVISVGFLRFTRDSHEAENISISPDRPLETNYVQTVRNGTIRSGNR